MSLENDQYQDTYKPDLSSVAALSFLVYDILITLDQEVAAVWSKPNRFYTKWLYFFVRYFAVAMQVSLLFVGTRLAFSFHYTESDCVKWYIFQEVGTQLLIAGVESILILRVHALYDRNRYVTLPLLVLFLAENAVMINALIIVVPRVRFDASCTVTHSPSSLLMFAYGKVSFLGLSAISHSAIKPRNSAAFISFETTLFLLTLAKFLIALRGGWGRTPVVYLLMRDGTWAFILIFATLCINAGFYLALGNSPMASIAYPWLLSIESFAGARVVLNLHAVSFDVSTDGFGTNDQGGGTLSSHIVFTTHSSVENRPRAPSVRWDWGGLQEYSRDDRTGRTNRSRSGTSTGLASESYEMTGTTSAGSSGRHKHGRHKASTSATNPTSPDTCSDTCVDVEQDEV